jgi:hypothetical protein
MAPCGRHTCLSSWRLSGRLNRLPAPAGLNHFKSPLFDKAPMTNCATMFFTASRERAPPDGHSRRSAEAVAAVVLKHNCNVQEFIARQEGPANRTCSPSRRHSLDVHHAFGAHRHHVPVEPTVRTPCARKAFSPWYLHRVSTRRFPIGIEREHRRRPRNAPSTRP